MKIYRVVWVKFLKKIFIFITEIVEAFKFNS